MKTLAIALILTFLIPIPAFAFTCVERTGTPTAPSDFSGFVCIGVNIIRQLVPLLIGLSFIVFLWGLAMFVRAAGDETAIQKGKDMMIYGIIGLLVMFSIWGIIRIMYTSLFGASGFSFPPQLPDGR